MEISPLAPCSWTAATGIVLSKARFRVLIQRYANDRSCGNRLRSRLSIDNRRPTRSVVLPVFEQSHDHRGQRLPVFVRQAGVAIDSSGAFMSRLSCTSDSMLPTSGTAGQSSAQRIARDHGQHQSGVQAGRKRCAEP